MTKADQMQPYLITLVASCSGLKPIVCCISDDDDDDEDDVMTEQEKRNWKKCQNMQL